MEIDINALKREKAENFDERLDFIDKYVEWLKRTPNKIWSAHQKEFIDGVYQTHK